MKRLYAVMVIGLVSIGMWVTAGSMDLWWVFVPSVVVTCLSIVACGTYGRLWGRNS